MKIINIGSQKYSLNIWTRPSHVPWGKTLQKKKKKVQLLKKQQKKTEQPPDGSIQVKSASESFLRD